MVASHAAFSPKAGLNVRYHKSATGTGNVYFTAGRSFKAPTLDQLFDQRPIPVPFPPFSLTTSNPLLRPQSGTSIEAGVYQDGSWSSLRASASVSVYQMDMKDELDFDLQTLRYVNIGSSRHRGVEAGLVLSGPAGTSLFANYTLQAARSQSGDNTGNYLKAIPRHTLSGGASVTLFSRLEASTMVTSDRWRVPRRCQYHRVAGVHARRRAHLVSGRRREHRDRGPQPVRREIQHHRLSRSVGHGRGVFLSGRRADAVGRPARWLVSIHVAPRRAGRAR